MPQVASSDSDTGCDTRTAAYAERLARLEGARWKRWLDVQAPRRWHLRRLRLGRTLDVGCDIGRYLRHLPPGSVGVEPNPHAVEIARRRGCEAYTPEAFAASPAAARPFDALLVSHVLEHLDPAGADALLARYLPYLRAGARVVLLTPQEAGFRADPTHRTFVGPSELHALLVRNGCIPERCYSFPFPRPLGRWFPYNEF